jgi:transglutaminase-like putative cysteine protease
LAASGLSSLALARARRPEKLVTLLLLFVLLTAATAGVTSILISPDWGSLWRSLTFGLLAGWTLAIFSQPAWRAGLITAAAGASYTLLFASGLREQLATILIELASLAGRLGTTPNNLKGDGSGLTQSLQDFFSASGVILERVRTWTAALIAGEPVFDPVAAALVWSLLVWLIAAWAGWAVEARRSALLASLPALLLSLGTLSYGQRESTTIYFMLASALLLLATVQLDQHKQGWESANIAYPPRKGRQIGNTAAIVVAALVVISAFVSSISIPRIFEMLSERTEAAPQQEGDLAKSLGILVVATKTPDSFEDFRQPGLPRELLIGSGPELSRRRVMTVEIENFPAIFKDEQPGPLYWRSFTYDKYTGHGWRTSSTSLDEIPPNQSLQLPQMPYHILIRQTVRSVGTETSTLHVAGEALAVDQHSRAAWRSSEDLFGIQIERTAGYTATSLLPVADERALRSAGQAYPGWVKQRYLPLPSELPNRIKELAIQLTAAQATPYDRARAIETYLRRIPYTLDVPLPPADQDLVEYFLFDLRKGYCDYYASAMVVLARAAGIPARIAVGYASGAYDLNSQRFQVTQAEAHSWVEVYFPEVGWVAFEPTAARLVVNKPQSSQPSTRQDFPTTPAPEVNALNWMPGAWLIALGVLLAASLLALSYIASIEVNLRHLPEPEAANQVYRRLKRYGSRLAVEIGTGATPYEFESALRARIQELSLWGKRLPVGGDVPNRIASLIEEIVRISYHPNPTQEQPDKTVYAQWRKIRWQLRLMWLVQHIKSIYDRLSGLWAGAASQDITEIKQEA